MSRIVTKSGTARWSQCMLGLSVSALIVFAGCSGTSAPKTIQVQGKVTYKGEPVTKGTVSFLPLEAADGYPSRAATGTINPDGTYQLATFAENDGAIPGRYQVAVVSIISKPSAEERNVPEVWAVPKKYGTAAQSGLTATIPTDAKGPLELDFALED